MTPSPLQLIIVLVIVLLLFGRNKIPQLMGDIAKGIKSFKSGMKDEEKKFKCPICKKTALGDREKSSYFPFCSERCRTIDLGAWLDEK